MKKRAMKNYKVVLLHNMEISIEDFSLGVKKITNLQMLESKIII